MTETASAAPSVAPESIYGSYRRAMERVRDSVIESLEQANARTKESTGYSLYEHVNTRIKSDESMREKCERKGLEANAYNALTRVRDAIGVRVVTRFIDDIELVVRELEQIEGVEVVEKKDYVFNAKLNGYRSHHVIASVRDPLNPASAYFVEVQIRTIAMDSWAALEHELKYKKGIKNQERIVAELKRCADELASCDMSMQTIRHLMNEAESE
ncbi:GTP pyrophosphokinase [Alloscardovia omnicolens]|uniref:GTP pyrophosphokinase n=1 Tax=Alloscardovia omnicolens TaxID=419015 RepID=UPI00254DF281|nr:GTP pyrophosphokinase family protein [Alloscardovia omnicolens]MDK6522246.1 GTP pyrophosphokinase family protein [Alloscardovia omnicolens]